MRFYLCFLLVCGWYVSFAQVPGNPNVRHDPSYFIYSGTNDDVVHLVWDESDRGVSQYVVEQSFDNIFFRSIDSIVPVNLFDIHSNNYPSNISYNNSILYSTETGAGRFIYNDLLVGNELQQRNIWYRVRMVLSNGSLVYTKPVLESFEFEGADSKFPEEELEKQPFELAQLAPIESERRSPGGRRASCPSVQSPPSGYIYTGVSQTYYGDCCYWVEREYIQQNITASCGSYQSWCCQFDCSPLAYDPCCVHICTEYNQCSCHPWECCPVQNFTVYVVHSSVNYTVTTTTTVSDLSCYQSGDGYIIADGNNGPDPYTYAWSNGMSGDSIGGLSAGTYTVTVTDDAGCFDVVTVTVSQPPPLQISLTSQTFLGGNNVSCFGEDDGSASVAANGGTPPYDYLWDGNTASQNTATATGLSAGTYTVTVTDDNDCEIFGSITLTQPDELNTVLNATAYAGGVNITCSGENDGNITAIPTGGVNPYSFNWSNNVTTANNGNLTVGTYTVTVTDTNGCEVIETVTLSEPDEFLGTLNITDINCFGWNSGSATLVVSGGTAPASYIWSDGFNDASNEDLFAGTYNVTATDANGCSFTDVAVITQPDEITATTSSSNASCGVCNGSASIGNVQGGSGSYSYLWSNGGTATSATSLCAGVHNVVVTDNNEPTCSRTFTATVSNTGAETVNASGIDISCFGACDGQVSASLSGGCTNPPCTYTWYDGVGGAPVGTGLSLTGLCEGTYSIEVENNLNCLSYASATIAEPDSISVTTTVTGITCAGQCNGSIFVSPSGGSPSYSYQWTDGGGNSIPGSGVIFNLCPDTYTVVVSDNNGCSSTYAYSIASQSLSASVNVTNANCNGAATGSAEAIVTGVNTPFGYEWYSGATLIGTGNMISGLSAGSYTVEVTDALGCTIIEPFSVTEPPAISVSANGTDALCFGECTGEASASANGGSGTLSYQWTDAQGFNIAQATNPTLSNICAGTYYIVVTDAQGCSATPVPVVINEPLEISITGVVTYLTCSGDSSGVIEITVAGGAGSNTYSWNNGDYVSEDLNDVPAGSYNVVVTDVNGCTATDDFIISEPQPLGLLLTAGTYIGGSNVSCVGASDGSINSTVNGGVPPYNYQWNPGTLSGPSVSGLQAGIYTLTVSDSLGCEIVRTVTLNEPTPMSSAITTQIFPGNHDVSCFGASNGSATVTVTGGNPPYSYLWSDSNKTTPTISYLSLGTYYVTLTDANGCEITDSVTLDSEPSLLDDVLVPSVYGGGFNISCYGGNDGSIDMTVTGGTPPYRYTWNGGTWHTEDIDTLTAGQYWMIVVDTNGCIIRDTIDLTEPPAFNVTTTVTDVECGGDSTGEIVTAVTGGVPPYSYSWNNGQYLTADLNNVPAGQYIIEVTDTNGCLAYDTAVVDEPTVLSISLSDSIYPNGFNISCFGASDGFIDLTVSGGTPPYIFSWNSGWSSDEDLQNVPLGNYIVTVIDSFGCMIQDSIELTEPPLVIDTAMISICDNDSFFVANAWQSSSGVYYDTLTTFDGCDSIIQTELTILPTFFTQVQESICDNDSFFVANGWQNVAGLYYDTLQAANGCDSVIETDLIILPTYFSPVQVSICDNDSFYVANGWQNTAGLYYDTLQAQNSCDSVIETDLVILPTFFTQVQESICDNDSFYVANGWQNTAGLYYDTLQAQNSCDSVIETDLVILPTFFTQVQESICDNDSFFVANGWQQAAGLYYDTLQAVNGCDSVIETDLEILPTYFSPVQVSICDNDSFYVANGWQNTAGLYYDTLQAQNSCDSVIETDLVILPTFFTPVQESICDNDSFFVANGWQQAAGLYYDTLQAVNGCDSVIETDLEILPTYFSPVQVSICDNDSFYVANGWQNTAGLYYDTLQAQNSCDSVIETDLVILPTFFTPVQESICDNDSIYVANGWQNTAGLYYDTLQAQNSCDSVIETDLIVLPTFTVFDTIMICDDDSAFVAGSWESTNGSYVEQLLSSEGCDSVIITELIVHPTYVTPQQVSICDNDSIFLENDWQNTAGLYYDSLSSTEGCDSVIETTLSIVAGFLTQVSEEICPADSIYVGGAWQHQPGVYYDTLLSSTSCDSVVETIVSSITEVYDSITVSICEGDSFDVGGGFQSSAGIYFDSLVTPGGCDSIIVTELIVIPTVQATATETICEGDSVFLGSAWQITAGIYVDTLQSASGCDSILSTDLQVIMNGFVSVSQTICEGDSLFVGGGWQTLGGTYMDTLLSASNCDSIVETALAILPNSTSSFQITICVNDSAFLASEWQDTPGFYDDTLTSSIGCDSVLTTELITVNEFYSTDNATICNGDSFYVGGNWQSVPGIYWDTVMSSSGCDSIIETSLQVVTTLYDTAYVTICDGDSYFAGGASQTSAGTFYDDYTSSGGCDSTLVTILDIITIQISGQVTDVVCVGGSDGSIDISVAGGMPNYQYAWSNGQQTEDIDSLEAGSYTVTVTDADGCTATATFVVSDQTNNVCRFESITKTYGGSGDDWGHSVVQTNDGGFIIAGVTSSFGAGSEDLFVLKTDAAGTAQWSKTYGGNNRDYGRSVTIKQTNDGGFIVAGATSSFGGPGQCSYILRLDNVGTLIWDAKIGGVDLDHDDSRCVQQTVDGGFVFSGTTNSYSSGGADAYLFKLDGTGNILWSRVFGGIGADHAPYLEQTPDGGFILVGNTETYSSGPRAGWLIKTNDSGLLEWNKTYDETDEQAFMSLDQTADGGFIVVGRTEGSGAGQNDIILVKTDADGNVAWAKAYGGAGMDRGIYVREKASGSFVMSGLSESFGSGGRDLIMVEVDATGNVEFASAYGGPVHEDAAYWSENMTILPNGAAVFTGSTRSYGSGNDDIVLVKYTASCPSCIALPITPIVTNLNLSVASPNPGLNTGANSYSAATITSDWNLTELDVCQDTSVSPLDTTHQSFSFCEGDSIYLEGGWQSFSGTYFDTLSNANGCDSILITDLLVLQSTSGSDLIEICAGDSVNIQGEWQYSTGTYYDTLINDSGCDSILITDLALVSHITAFDTIEVCDGDSAFINGNWQHSPGSYFDTIRPANSCDTVVEISLIVQPEIQISGYQIVICPNEDSTLSAPSGYNGYLWSPGGETTTDITVELPGTYGLTVTDANGCTGTASYIVSQADLIDLEAIYDTTKILPGDSVYIELSSTNPYVDINWDPIQFIDCDTCDEVNSFPPSTVTYTVVAWDGNNCTDTTFVTINVDADVDPTGDIIPFFHVPNAFSPNGDGHNETFEVFVGGYERFRLLIFDRWGEKLFETNDPTHGWDGTFHGKELPSGVYVYYVDILFNGDIKPESYTKHWKGSITLLR